MAHGLEWEAPLYQRRGGETYLDGIAVFYDFDWYDVFGHNRSQFPKGQCLARLARDNCTPGLTPALLLTTRDDAHEGLRTTDSHFFLVVNIRRYLSLAAGDPALSYYASGLRSQIARLEELQAVATDPAVIDAVLTAERAAAAQDPERRAQLKEALGLTDDVIPDLPSLLEALGALSDVELDADAVAAMAALFGANADRERRLELLRAITEDPSGRYVTGEVLAERTAERIADARAAMADYQSLLDDRGTSERDMQAFIENNLWLLGLDYARMVARQRTISGTVDFALERFDGFQDVLELKSPQDPIIRVQHDVEEGVAPPPSAYSLSPDLAQALGQVHSYRERLTRHAEANADLLGLPATRDPRLMIVLGRADRLDEHSRRVLSELNKSLHRVEVVPYDVLSRRADAVLNNVEKLIAAHDGHETSPSSSNKRTGRSVADP